MGQGNGRAGEEIFREIFRGSGEIRFLVVEMREVIVLCLNTRLASQSSTTQAPFRTGPFHNPF